jgi:hypothetical protein
VSAIIDRSGVVRHRHVPRRPFTPDRGLEAPPYNLSGRLLVAGNAAIIVAGLPRVPRKNKKKKNA